MRVLVHALVLQYYAATVKIEALCVVDCVLRQGVVNIVQSVDMGYQYMSL